MLDELAAAALKYWFRLELLMDMILLGESKLLLEVDGDMLVSAADLTDSEFWFL